MYSVIVGFSPQTGQSGSRRSATSVNDVVSASGETVRAVIDDLVARYPGLGRQLVEDGDVAPFVNVYLEGEDVRTLDGLDTSVADDSTVILLPAMAGGC